MGRIQVRRILTVAFLAMAAPSWAHAQTPNVQKFQIQLTDPAYTGMPVWIHAELSFPLEIRYPYGEDPEDFGPNRLEVKRENSLLPKVPFKPWVGGGGLLDGSIAPAQTEAAETGHDLWMAALPGSMDSPEPWQQASVGSRERRPAPIR